jgi:hypothetical protein
VSSAIEVEEPVLKLKKYRVKYRNYWLSTANDTSTGKFGSTRRSIAMLGCQLTRVTTVGRPVDAVILPVIPSAAVIPGKLFHYGNRLTLVCSDSSRAI